MVKHGELSGAPSASSSLTKNPADGARRVVAALSASSLLGDTMRQLQRSLAGTPPPAPSTASTLASYFLLSEAEKQGFEARARETKKKKTPRVAGGTRWARAY